MKKRDRIFAAVLMLGSLLCAALLAWVYFSTHPPMRSLTLGDAGAAVTNAQLRLRQLQFTTSSASGVYDDETEAAADRFRALNSLSDADGLSAKEQKLLFGDDAVASTFRTHFIDVGQGDAALVLCDGHAMLIDGGGKSASSRIYSYLEDQEVGRLDLVLCTHPHEDHAGGLSGALHQSEAETLWCTDPADDSSAFQTLLRTADERGVAVQVPVPGQTFALGSAKVTVLGPVEDDEDVNNASIVVRVDYYENAFLFTGDAELTEEYSLMAAGASLDADVLKVGHHGSASSSSREFLEAVTPEVAVISVGEGNRYGHPTDQALGRLQGVGAQVYRTDLQGHIVIEGDGREIRILPQRETPEVTAPPATAAPGDVTYIINRSSGVFHAPSCSGAAKMKEKNRMDSTQTRDELLALGYKPCGSCKP